MISSGFTKQRSIAPWYQAHHEQQQQGLADDWPLGGKTLLAMDNSISSLSLSLPPSAIGKSFQFGTEMIQTLKTAGFPHAKLRCP